MIQIQDSAGVKTNATSLQLVQIKTDLGLEQVNNTADSVKPVSTAQAAADTAVLTSANASLVAHTGNAANPHSVTKAQVGLPLVDNTADASKPVSTLQAAAIGAKIDSSLIGVANGVVPLDGTNKIASVYLPSYVDDVLEFANAAAFPGTGETGKIYVDINTNLQYRWSGSAYVTIVSSPGTTDAVVEGATNLYHTVARVRAVLLTGIDLATNAAVVATDTVMGAIGKLSARLEALVTTVALKAAQVQEFSFGYGIVGALANGDYTIMIRSPNFAITVTEWATKAGAGSATATFKIGATPFGGTPNAVSTTLQTQAQTSANVIAANSVVVVTISANAGCSDLSIAARYTRTMVA